MYADSSWNETAGRLLIAFCFVTTGLCNLTRARIRDHIERMDAFGTPFPRAAFWVGMALQFTGCALVLLDWQARAGVWCLIAFTVAATAIFHRFWSMPDATRRNTSRIILLGNTAVLGGLFLLLGTVR
ncbi:MAG: DoxX family protein [Burkholderiales bacterium]